MGQNDVSDVLNKIAGAGKLTEYAPPIPLGNHVLAIRKSGIRQTREYGRVIEIEFSVAESSALEPKSWVGEAHFIDKPGLEGQYAQKRFNTFVSALAAGLGIPESDEDKMNKLKVGLLNGSQLGRGFLVRSEGAPRTTKKGREVVNVSWSPYQNTEETISKMRAWLDEHAPLKDTDQGQSQPAPQPAPEPAPAPSPTPAPAQGGGSILGNL